MGCDVHVMVDRYNKDENKWENLSLYKRSDDGLFERADVYDGRSYELFGLLAGVRGGNCLVHPRGLPDDLSPETAEYWGDGEWWHTPTWYDYCELEAYEYMLKQLDKAIKEINRLENELAKANGDDFDMYAGLYGDDCDDDYGAADLLSGFIEKIRFILDAYDEWYPKPNDIRIVMWFDN